ncbi:unnamed protein product, partial [Rotaria sordida]
ELTFSQIDNNDTISSWSIKIVISLSTVVLIGFVVQYHHLDLSLYAVNNSIADYRVAITYQKILLIVLEILVCAVHPMPRSFPRHSNPSVENINSNSSTFNRYPLSYISVDVALGFPMFARVYLLCRFVMFHSHVFHDISSRSVGYLNKISIDYVFLIKAYLQQYPVSCLTTVCIIVFFIGSWCTRACDYTPTNEHVSMPQAMWFFIVTFTTIGYGDFTPSTYCGRAIATIIGLYGILVAALLITVLTQKLLLNRWEKYVHSFVLNVEFAKNRKIQAANVIKFAFQAWYLKKKNTSEFSIQHLRAQQRLFQSIRSLHEIKQKQGQQVDNCVDQIDIISVQRISSLIGLFGILITVLVITVLTQKLLLNRWEKYVHTFVLNVELAKNRKIQAANVIKFAFQVWILKKKNVSKSSIRYLRAQRDLFQSIHFLHEIKQKQGQQVDNCVDQIDVVSVQRNTSAQVDAISEQLNIMQRYGCGC